VVAVRHGWTTSVDVVQRTSSTAAQTEDHTLSAPLEKSTCTMSDSSASSASAFCNVKTQRADAVLSIDRSIDLSIDLSIYRSIYRSIDLSIYISIYLSIYLKSQD